KKAGPRIAPVHWAAGSDGETSFGLTSLAAPKAASSRLARYSLTARLVTLAAHSLFHSAPGIERCLLASAAIKLPSTANPSPPTSPAAMHVCTTCSNTAENVAVTKPLIAGARERRMIRDLVFDRKPTEPAISKVHLHIAAQRSLRADGEHIPDDQHSDHQLWIDRGPTGIMRCQLGTDP